MTQFVLTLAIASGFTAPMLDCARTPGRLRDRRPDLALLAT